MGMFLRRIQQVQDECIIVLLRLLLEHKVPVRLPLSRWLSVQSSQFHKAAKLTRQVWYAAELIRTIQLGTFRAWEYVALDDEFANEIDLFTAIENISVLIEWVDQCTGTGELLGPPALKQRFDGSNFREAYQDLAMTQTMWATQADDFNLAAVLESTAYVSELYGVGDKDFAIAQRISQDKQDSVYGFLLNLEPATALKQAAPLEQILTRRAAAEICLFGPVLHELFQLRKAMRLQDYMPLARYLRLCSLEDVEPVKDHADVPRYYDDVCERTNWTHPRDICEMEWRFFAKEEADHRNLAFLASLTARRIDPSIFIDPTAALFTQTALHRRVASIFDFATIEFTDGRELLHRDRSRVAWFKLDYLWGQWLRHMMVSTRPVLKLNWRSNAEERQFLGRKLQERLAYMVDADFPPPRLEGPESV